MSAPVPMIIADGALLHVFTVAGGFFSFEGLSLAAEGRLDLGVGLTIVSAGGLFVGITLRCRTDI